MLRRSAGSQFVWRAELLASAVKHARFQDLSRFRLPKESRGRPAWFVQLWWLFDALFVRSSPQVLYSWRRFWLRVFGAKIGRNVLIRPGVRVIFPWKVVISDFCWIGDNSTLYSIANITIGDHSVVSQEVYLCTGTHDHCDISFPLVASPITVGPECWIAARAFVGPGVRIGQGAVVGVGSVALSDVPEAKIVAGIPARVVGERKMRNSRYEGLA
jgi:putative colanic acid biosynthesis acetyltransferase WcaF